MSSADDWNSSEVVLQLVTARRGAAVCQHFRTAQYSPRLTQLTCSGGFLVTLALLICDTLEFYILGSVHRESNLITVKQDATYSVYYISVGSCTCFGC